MRDHNSLPNLARETLGTPCLDTRLTRQAHMCEQSAAMVSKLRSLEDTDTVDILACESNSQTHDSFVIRVTSKFDGAMIVPGMMSMRTKTCHRNHRSD